MLEHRVNEQAPKSDFKLCPICRARIPFSLAMHMVAAHSPNAIENSAETPDVKFREFQALAHQQSPSNLASESKRSGRSAGARPRFVRRKGNGRH